MKTLVKSEPVQLQQHQPSHMGAMPSLPYIKKEDSNNFENNNFNCGGGGDMSHPNIYSQQLQQRLSPPSYKYSPAGMPGLPQNPMPNGAIRTPTILAQQTEAPTSTFG